MRCHYSIIHSRHNGGTNGRKAKVRMLLKESGLAYPDVFRICFDMGGGLQSSYGGTLLIVEMEDDTSFIFVRM